MLQATADASALAAVIDLPDAGAAVTTAVFYSDNNMPTNEYGTILRDGDVEVGAWDVTTHIFSPGAVLPDAVRITARRSIENDNPAPVNFLRIVGLYDWNITTYAIAQRFIPDCLTDGLVAGGIVDLSSGNTFSNEMCIHGQQGVSMQNGNVFDPAVRVTMPDLANNLVTPGDRLDSNLGLVDALGEQYLAPRMVNHVSEIMRDLLTMEPYVTPDYIDTLQDVIVRDKNYNFSDVEPGRVYHIDCDANNNVGVPNGAILDRIVIVADCQIGVGSGVEMMDVVLASTAAAPGGTNKGGGGNSGHGGARVQNANINVSANVVLGDDDDCAPGGGVQIFSNASIRFASTTTYNGVQIVVSGDIDLGARDEGINGINAQAGGNIAMTSNSKLSLCTGGAPDLFTVGYYRLVY